MSKRAYIANPEYETSRWRLKNRGESARCQLLVMRIKAANSIWTQLPMPGPLERIHRLQRALRRRRRRSRYTRTRHRLLLEAVRHRVGPFGGRRASACDAGHAVRRVHGEGRRAQVEVRRVQVPLEVQGRVRVRDEPFYNGAVAGGCSQFF
jgi:hypothetical protein